MQQQTKLLNSSNNQTQLILSRCVDNFNSLVNMSQFENPNRRMLTQTGNLMSLKTQMWDKCKKISQSYKEKVFVQDCIEMNNEFNQSINNRYMLREINKYPFLANAFEAVFHFIINEHQFVIEYFKNDFDPTQCYTTNDEHVVQLMNLFIRCNSNLFVQYKFGKTVYRIRLVDAIVLRLAKEAEITKLEFHDELIYYSVIDGVGNKQMVKTDKATIKGTLEMAEKGYESSLINNGINIFNGATIKEELKKFNFKSIQPIKSNITIDEFQFDEIVIKLVSCNPDESVVETLERVSERIQVELANIDVKFESIKVFPWLLMSGNADQSINAIISILNKVQTKRQMCELIGLSYEMSEQFDSSDSNANAIDLLCFLTTKKGKQKNQLKWFSFCTLVSLSHFVNFDRGVLLSHFIDVTLNSRVVSSPVLMTVESLVYFRFIDGWLSDGLSNRHFNLNLTKIQVL